MNFMGLYEGIKDMAKVLQKAGNIDLYSKLIDLGAQALEMQNEIARLTNENLKLKESKHLSDKVERYSEPFITLNGEKEHVLYCARCWGDTEKLIQVRCYDNGEFKCCKCNNNGVYDKNKKERYDKEKAEFFNTLYTKNNNRHQW